MPVLLEGKTVLVTGGSSGIGAAAAVEAARHGADVAINYVGNEAGANLVVARIAELGRRAVAIRGDVAEAATAKTFVADAVAALGRVDIFVSNAGICPFHAFLDMPADLFERTMAVNLHGAFYMVQAAANQMVAQGDGGAIVAVSSISALVGGEYQTHYTPTKAGIHSLMQSAAIALGRHGIRCNSVLPGTILTEINRDDLADAAKRARMAARVPLGRLGEAEDLAGPIIFLASDLARYVTGAALLVDGGAYVNLQ
jgi:L-rhamnose 1-dehydrogenase